MTMFQAKHCQIELVEHTTLAMASETLHLEGSGPLETRWIKLGREVGKRGTKGH